MPPTPQAPAGYERRRPEQTVLFQLLNEHLEDFLAHTDEVTEGNGLPRFVKRELRDFLTCGVLERGFARVYCRTCRDDFVVGFTCRGRGVCPTCLGRRMNDTAAHLVDRVIPRRPTRQFVVTFPWPLRLKLAYDAELTNAVLTIFMRALTGYYRKRAKRLGVSDGRCGAVVALHRAGSALNVNLHLHVLQLDGVFYQREPDGPIRFLGLTRHNDKEFRQLAHTVRDRIIALLRRRGLLPGPDDDAPTEAQLDLLERLTELSVAGLNPDGTRPAREGETQVGPRKAPARGSDKPHNSKKRKLCHSVDGFSLHARTTVAAGRRGDLEVLCRYLLKPPITYDQVELREDGRVAWHLRRTWSDGTRTLFFEPYAFIARLAPLVPPPRRAQLRYFGVLAPNAKWRAEVVASAPKAGGVRRSRDPRCRATRSTTSGGRYLSWAALLKRTYGFDILLCCKCGGRRELVSFIQDPAVAHHILTHLGLAGFARPPP